MSSSFFVNTAYKIYKVLDNYFENSFLNKLLCKIGDLSKNSYIVNFIIKIIATKNSNNAKENSFIINLINKILVFINSIFFNIYKYVTSKNQNSIISSFSKNFFGSINNLGKLLNATCFISIGFFAINIVFSIIKYGISLKILLINIISLIVVLAVSFLDVNKLDSMIKNNMISKLIKWFFVS